MKLIYFTNFLSKKKCKKRKKSLIQRFFFRLDLMRFKHRTDTYTCRHRKRCRQDNENKREKNIDGGWMMIKKAVWPYVVVSLKIVIYFSFDLKTMKILYHYSLSVLNSSLFRPHHFHYSSSLYFCLLSHINSL